jgi:23S rRNA A1618 N6-methylase RlmF
VLKAITPAEVRDIAALAKQARHAQEVLLDKVRIVDRNDDGRLVEDEITSSTEVLDMTLDNPPLEDLKRRLAALDDEARHEVRALMSIGRGLFAPNELEAALDDARARHAADEVEAIAEKVGLDEWLSKALFELALT